MHERESAPSVTASSTEAAELGLETAALMWAPLPVVALGRDHPLVRPDVVRQRVARRWPGAPWLWVLARWLLPEVADAP